MPTRVRSRGTGFHPAPGPDGLSEWAYGLLSATLLAGGRSPAWSAVSPAVPPCVCWPWARSVLQPKRPALLRFAGWRLGAVSCGLLGGLSGGLLLLENVLDRVGR